MKKIVFLLFALASFASIHAQTYEYKIVTVIESIISSGVGRSRILDANEDVNYKKFATTQTEDEKKTNDAARGDIRIGNYEETKILNFFNLGGINMANVASNDAMVASKLNDLATQGWEVAFVTSGVESQGAANDPNGIFVTRYVLRRTKK